MADKESTGWLPIAIGSVVLVLIVAFALVSVGMLPVTSGGSEPTDVITDPADLDKHLGRTVFIRGKLERLKLPSVLGAELAADDATAAPCCL